MAGLVPAIHVLLKRLKKEDVDARHKAGHDEILDSIPLTSTDRSNAGSTECPPPASGSRAICWHGPILSLGPRVRSPHLASAGRYRAASTDGNPRRRGWQRSAAPDSRR